MKELWVEKYRPTSVDDYIFQDRKHELSFLKMIADQSIPHLILAGVQGSGKTTLARILINEVGVDPSDVLTINGSDENNVETVRDKIKTFVMTFAMGPFKIVHLEEMDYFSLNAQAILRNLMEEYAEAARFIITCNYENKIMPSIKSRCQTFRFKAADRDDIAEYLVKMLASEKVKFSLDQLDRFIAAGYPDIRQIVHLLQQHVVEGKLQDPHTTADGDYKFELLELMETDNWSAIRQCLCANVVTEEWEDVYRFVYDNLHKCPKFSSQRQWEEGIIIIAEHLYKHGIVADPEINASAMFIRLEHI